MSLPGQRLFFKPPTVAELSGRYPHLLIEKFVGAGGMGAVYCARQVPLDRPVALKILPPGLERDEEFFSRFIAEAQAMARLNHPNLIAIYDFGDEKGQPYLVMEYVDGPSLEAVIAEKRLSPERAARLICQLCDGLGYAHSRGVLHRDIKPANILVTADGVAKIGDFGLARAMCGARAVMVRSKQPLGTPGYVAPEVYEVTRPLDHRADIFALGALFYEMLAGEAPKDNPAPPSTRRGSPVVFDPVVARAMAAKPLERYGSTADMKAAIMAALQKGRPRAPAQSTTASIPVTVRPTRPLVVEKSRRNTAWLIAGGIALGAVAAGAWIVFSRPRHPSNLAGSAATPTANSSSSPAAAPPPVSAVADRASSARPTSSGRSERNLSSADRGRSGGRSDAPASSRPAESGRPGVASAKSTEPDTARPPGDAGPVNSAALLTAIKSLRERGEKSDALSGTAERNGHTYLAVRTRLPWSQARSFAERAGGHLATITSAEENRFLHEKVLKSFVPSGSRWQFWLGGTDAETEDKWKWVTGEPWEFVLWAPDEPDRTTRKNALSIMVSGGGENPGGWSDSGDDTPGIAGLVIEWDSTPPATGPVASASPLAPDDPLWGPLVRTLREVVAPKARAHEERLNELGAKYVAALTRTAQSVAPAAAETIRAEITRFHSDPTVPETTPPESHSEISRLQDIWRQERSRLHHSLEEEIGELMPAFLRALEREQEKLDAASSEAARLGAEIERLRNDPVAFLTFALSR